jgi:nascent polypeptide-associated complex subunit alpha
MTAEIEKHNHKGPVGNSHDNACCDHDHDYAHDHDRDHDHFNDHDHDHDHDNSDTEGEELAGDDKVLNRNEKKARKLLSKLGLKPVVGIERVTIKRSRMIFAIANPTVFKSGDSYIVFGEAKVEDAGFQAQAMAAQKLAMAAQAEEDGKEKVAVVEEDEEEVDMSGVDMKDVNIVMEQTSVSKAKAVAALKANNNDIVNTIMELTM